MFRSETYRVSHMSILTDEQLGFFRQNGFLLIEGLIPEAELVGVQRDRAACCMHMAAAMRNQAGEG